MNRFYRVRLDRYQRGGPVTSRLAPEIYTEMAEAKADCMRLQGQFDAACEPVAVFVVDGLGIPRWRIGAIDQGAEEFEARSRPQRQRVA